MEPALPPNSADIAADSVELPPGAASRASVPDAALRARWGRFTHAGSAQAEARIHAVVSEIADRLAAALPPGSCRAVVMLGGYGRGEGGVEVRDGVESPHNNFDFLVIMRPMSRAAQSALRERLLASLVPVVRDTHVEIDLTVADSPRLHLYRSLIVWYDMRFGHKTILGDPDLVPGLTRFRLDRIPAWDARNLLVNRGTLLLVNDEILQHENLGLEQRKRVVRNAMKAVIGYGDALLFFLGRYDWSYAERQRRMRDIPAHVPDIRALYDAAMTFRFQPAYDRLVEMDLRLWMATLRRELEPVHLFCERTYLRQPQLAWPAFPEAALRHWITADGFAARTWAGKIKNLVRNRPHLDNLSGPARLGYRLMRLRNLYAVMHPIVAYDVDDAGCRAMAAQTLGAVSTDTRALRRAYLRFWTKAIDVNCDSVLRLWETPGSERRPAP